MGKELTKGVSEDILCVNAGAVGTEATHQSVSNLAVKLYIGENTSGESLWDDSWAPAVLSVLNLAIVFKIQEVLVFFFV